MQIPSPQASRQFIHISLDFLASRLTKPNQSTIQPKEGASIIQFHRFLLPTHQQEQNPPVTEMHQSPNLHGKSCSRESKFWSRRFRTRTIMLLPKEENHGTVVAAIEATNAQDRSIKTHNHQTRRIFGLNYRHTHDISQDPIGCLKLGRYLSWPPVLSCPHTHRIYFSAWHHCQGMTPSLSLTRP